MGTKIINLFGGPGVGKSTIASGLFYHMKMNGFKVEYASEWIKDKIYEGDKYPFLDELYAFAKQNKKINQMRDKLDYVITDSPLPLVLLYSTREPNSFEQLVMDVFNSYDNVNFLIKRNHDYQEFGRNQNEKESEKLHRKLEDLLRKYNIKFYRFKSTEALDKIKNEVLRIDEESKKKV